MSALGGSAGLGGIVSSLSNGAASGTGIVPLVPKVMQLLGVTTMPQYLVDYALSTQHSLFGDYPTSKDVAPSAIFTAVFFILMLAHLYVFAKNYSRGHKFWLSLGFAFYSLLRWLGFAMRVKWAKDIQSLKVGIASSVFIIVPSVILASFNLILAQRIFTWRHPHIGSTRLFWGCMLGLYAFVMGIIVMAIVGAAVPYLYFLSEHRFHQCKQAVQAASIFAVLYSGNAFILLMSAFILPPSAKAKKVWTYQPWWIESFNTFYYVPKGAPQRAEQSFEERDPECTHAVRIIASTTHYHNTLEKTQSVTSKSGKLEHNHSIFLVVLTTFILMLSSLFRCVSTFIDSTYASQSWIFKPVVMYIMFGLLETIVNVIYLTSRVDLRFYRPDKLRPDRVGCSQKRSDGAGAGVTPMAENETLMDQRSREDKPYSEVVHNDHSSTE